MTVFASAGHNPKGIKPDPGAIGNGYHEADLTVEFRDLVITDLLRRGVKVIQDKDDERLGTYLERIKTGSGSVVIEYHFDAADSPTATGTTSLVGDDADRLDKAFGKELADTTSSILGIKNRGVKAESESHRGRLGLMRELGIVALQELCFISNANDLKLYHSNKHKLAIAHAEIIQRYENMI
jgi:N-acetylmuramoyl-L-alanine amidase